MAEQGKIMDKKKQMLGIETTNVNPNKGRTKHWKVILLETIIYINRC